MAYLGRRTLFSLGLAMSSVGLNRRGWAANSKMVIGTGVDPSFSAYYVAKEGGIFEKHGLDVRLNTGPSGSAMVGLLIQNQIQSAFGAEQAGVMDHNLDPNVVVAAEGAKLTHWYGIVGRNLANVDALKGKRLGVARASGSEVFWSAVVDKFKLNRSDYTIVQVEAPEMVAALERGDIDAFSAWEPWLTRATKAIPNTKVLIDNDGIIEGRVFIYVNRGWADKNPDPMLAFMQSMIDATAMINSKREEATALVARFLKMDPAMAKMLMSKLDFDVHLDQGSVQAFQIAEAALKSVHHLSKPLNWSDFFYPEPLRKLAPNKVNYKLPTA